jgi:hypothetical protein
VGTLVARMLARAPSKRPASAGEVARELREILARVGAQAPVAAQRALRPSEISTPGGSEAAYRPRPIDPRDASTIDAPLGRESLPSAAASIPGARSAAWPLAIGVAILTAIASLGAWAAIGGASASPPTTSATTPTTTPTTHATETTETDDPIPHGIAPEAVVLEPASRPTRRARVDAPTHLETTGAPPSTAEPITPTTHVAPAEPAPEPATVSEAVEPLPSSPGQRPASRLRIQYLGSAGTDQASVAASLDPRLERCITASRHYANRTVVTFRVTVEANASVSEARATSDEGTEAERSCVAEALRSTSWPSTGARRQVYVRITALL